MIALESIFTAKVIVRFFRNRANPSVVQEGALFLFNQCRSNEKGFAVLLSFHSNVVGAAGADIAGFGPLLSAREVPHTQSGYAQLYEVDYR